MSTTVAGKPLAGKVSLVTGSSRGNGAAIALHLASLGSDVVINYVSSSTSALQVASQARETSKVRAVAIQANVTIPSDIARLFQTAKAELGRLDIVVSNSGIEHFGDLQSVKPEEVDEVFATNVKAQFLVAQQAHGYVENGGRLILTSSVSAVWGLTRHAVYSASKSAIIGMVKCLAWDFGPKQITVNCIAPGGVKTDMYTHAARDYIPGGQQMSDDEVDQKVGAMSPFQRPGFPADIAGVVGLLASPEAGWITGQTVHASGGVHMAS